jgi:hypothetical protein
MSSQIAEEPPQPSTVQEFFAKSGGYRNQYEQCSFYPGPRDKGTGAMQHLGQSFRRELRNSLTIVCSGNRNENQSRSDEPNRDNSPT